MSKSRKSLEKLASLPWATWGRRESFGEFFKHWEQQSGRATTFVDPPSFDLILDLGSAEPAEVDRTVHSVLAQSYPHWKLWLRGTASTVRGAHPHDLRITYVDPGDETSWRTATGEYVGRLNARDVLSPVALYLLALEISKTRETEWVQSHEAIFEPGAERLYGVISRRPASLFDLRQFDSIGRFWIVRRASVDLWEEWDNERGFQLRFFESARRTIHCPMVLYYRDRANFDESLCSKEVAEVLQQHLDRTGFEGEIVSFDSIDGKRPRIRAKSVSPLSVSAVICFRDRSELMKECLGALEQIGSGVRLDVCLVDNDSSRAERKKIEALADKSPLQIKVISHPGPFNFAAMNNAAVRDHVAGELVLLLNNDVVLNPKVDLAEWAAWANAEDAGTVGILLRYPTGRIQHAGVRAFFGGEARLARIGNCQDDDPISKRTREVYANTFAAVMVRKKVYDRVGGLREMEMVNGFGDLVFNLACLDQGLSNRFLGHFEGIHHEGASRGAEFEYWEERSVEREFPQHLARMLHQDHGWNRTPAGDLRLKSMLWQWAKVTAREREFLDWFSDKGLDPRKAAGAVGRVFAFGLTETKAILSKGKTALRESGPAIDESQSLE